MTMPRALRPRRRRNADPSCVLCGNDMDLRRMGDGNDYCPACLTCSCSFRDLLIERDVCLRCLRAYHSLVTFDGYQIQDMEGYAADAFYTYGIDPLSLTVWSSREETALQNMLFVRDVKREPGSVYTSLPPHLRKR
jgi:hypothetical protein